MALRINQACWPNCAPCGGGPTIAGVTCVSRTGSGNLRGWSKIQNENSGDWNTRKYTRRDQSGSAYACALTTTASGCSGAVGDPEERRSLRVDVSGFALWDVATNAIDSSGCSRTSYFWSRPHNGSPDPSACNDGSGDVTTDAGLLTISPGTSCDASPDAIVGSLDSGIFVNEQACTTPFWSVTADDTNRSVTGSGCIRTATECGFCPSSVRAKTGGTIGYGFSVPDTVADALARGSSVEGSDCETNPGSIGATVAESTTQIAVSGATTVRATIDCTSLISGHNYEISATLTRRDSTTNAFISTDTVTISFTATGATDSVDYDVPVETGVKVNFDSADSIVEV